jgi:hypothetical protein
MIELIIRFFIGGLVVSAFAVISDLLKPKSFAGLFGAAPSIALASIGLTVLHQGKETASVEARSMIVGAFALLVYSVFMSYLILRFKRSALPVALISLLLWLTVASGLWYGLFAS